MKNKITQLVSLVATYFLMMVSASVNADEWVDITAQVDPAKHAVAGEWTKSKDGLAVGSMTGARLFLPAKPTGEYDFRVAFTRKSGVHSVGLFFVAGGKQAAFEIDAWGEHLAGLQNIRGQDFRTNPTRVTNQTLQNGRRYSAELRIRRDRVEAYLDDKLLLTHRTDGADFTQPDLWKLPDTAALGLGAWEAETLFHRVEVRRVSGDLPIAAASTPTTSKPSPSEFTPPMPNKPTTKPKTTQPDPSNDKKPRVLIVIANQHFFYREYSEPREELERVGCVVEVAAGRKITCHPHPGTGEGADRGAVNPDLTIADADASRYDAILFSGGWGSSMYQYAFEGSYNVTAYNGDRRTKDAVNKLINDFVKQDKYVCGLCHGVSVLAWSRVNGRSLLAGKRATGPTLDGPPGTYPGRRTTMPSRWNAEFNGARMVAPNSIGNPSTPADDVVVDGKIITGQDDPTARELGRQLAQLLINNRSTTK